MQNSTPAIKHLSRSNDGYLAGVSAGLGQYFGLNPTLIRIVWLVTVVGFGTGLFLYALLWWLMPREGQEPIDSTPWVRESNGSHHAPLVRSMSDRKVLGVCGALARRWNFDATLVRLGALSLMTASAGLMVVAYIIAAVVIPGASHAMQRSAAHPIEL